MAESPLFDLPPAPAARCLRCGRIFEAPIDIVVDGQTRRIPGHVLGDPRFCVPIEGLPLVRDARARKGARRGKR